jgi:hypothetical protein
MNVTVGLLNIYVCTHIIRIMFLSLPHTLISVPMVRDWWFHKLSTNNHGMCVCYVYMCVYMGYLCIYLRAYVCVCVCVGVNLMVHGHIPYAYQVNYTLHAHIYMYKHTHIYTYTAMFWKAHCRNAYFSEQCKDLINRILQPDPSRRIR